MEVLVAVQLLVVEVDLHLDRLLACAVPARTVTERTWLAVVSVGLNSISDAPPLELDR